jgi:tRNA pseudouridine32 synthase/23S rRNA pseudouridine746 synthase
VTNRTPVSLSEADIAAVRSWVIHEDEAVIAFNKPAGLSSQGGRIQAHTLDDLLWAFARSNGKRPDLVHRLDRDTSGLILLARDAETHRLLSAAFADRRVHKTYLARVQGVPAARGGLIDQPVARLATRPPLYGVVPVLAGGKPGLAMGARRGSFGA